jgi:hypothetical protein
VFGFVCLSVCGRVSARVRVSSCVFVFILAARVCVRACVSGLPGVFVRPVELAVGHDNWQTRSTLQRAEHVATHGTARGNEERPIAAAHVETRAIHPHLSMYTSISIYNVWLHIYGTTGLVRSPSMIRRTRKHAHAYTPAEARTHARSRSVPAFLL